VGNDSPLPLDLGDNSNGSVCVINRWGVLKNARKIKFQENEAVFNALGVAFTPFTTLYSRLGCLGILPSLLLV